jgi:DNA gyrase subunit B
MDPENRILHRVSIDDAIKADQTFSFLMGDDVQPRKDFIAENAKYVKNLDI